MRTISRNLALSLICGSLGVSLAVAQDPTPTPPEFAAGATPNYRAADPALNVVRIDRSLDESFIAVRVDTAGRIFLGGREAVFVLEPNADGSYEPRQELYRFPAHSWVGDIEIRGDDLYIATAAAIYRLPGGRLKRENLKPEKLVWGTPVDLHVTYHGLAFGPEGDLYFNSGDPLLNYGDWNRPDHFGHWTIFHGPNAEATPYTGVGAVFRCKPDGSDLRVVATGLRGSDGLCFSETWDLFTNDNDHESIPDRYTPYRILHVTQGADFGWPRGWAARRSPDRAELLDPINEGLGRGVPVGQCYYGDTHLPEAFRGCLLVAQWGHRNVTAYKLIPKGASYTTEERPLLLCDGRARPVGVCVGRGGRVFVTIAYMAQNEGSPTYASDLVLLSREQESGGRFEPYEASRVRSGMLLGELTKPEWSRRALAHQELVRRGEPIFSKDHFAELSKHAEAFKKVPATSHVAWLNARDLSRAVRANPDACASSWPKTEGEKQDNHIQALKSIARSLAGDQTLSKFWSKCLLDVDIRVRLVALAGLASVDEDAFDALKQLTASADDRVLRQAAAQLLARRASLAQIDRLLRSEDSRLRLAGVLASGMRLTIPEPLAPLPKELPLNYSSPNALFTVAYADGTVNLRDLGPVGSFTMAEYWKSVPHTDEQEKLFDRLMHALDDSDEPVRLQAAYYLLLLSDARSEPLIAKVTGEVGRRRLLESAATPITALWMTGPIDPLAPDTPDRGAIDLSARPGGEGWIRAEHDDGVYPVAAKAAKDTYGYFRIQSQRGQSVQLTIAYDGAIKVWQNGRVVYENDVGVIPGFRNTFLLDLTSGGNDILMRLRNDARPLAAHCTIKALAGVAVELPENLGIAGLADRLKSGTPGDAAVPEAFLTIDWPSAIAKADAERGRRLFGVDGVGCVKCHSVAPGDAGAGAPSLAEAAGRFTTAHLVESVLTPSRQVAPVFRGTLISTTDGRVVSGLITNETADSIEVLLPDATKTKIPTREIEDRKPMEISTMPAGLVKTPEELADILAFLMTAAPAKP